jgi:hypothetical protein
VIESFSVCCQPSTLTEEDRPSVRHHSPVTRPLAVIVIIIRTTDLILAAMASLDDVDVLLQQWKGNIVPRHFNAGFVTLSYVVSLIGAACTLELLNRRTAPKGKFNQYVPADRPTGLSTTAFCR